jgi:hypothetical protein
MEIELDLDELKSEADQLGVKYNPQIGAAKLKEKIDAYYESQETSGKEIQEAIQKNEAKEKSEGKSAVTDNKEIAKRKRIAEAKAKANKTRIVKIIDNDQRVNNQTTTCKVTSGNLYFDLGSVVIPLNVPVEVKQGHINVLKNILIPQHGKDTKTGLSSVRMVPRYTISYTEYE